MRIRSDKRSRDAGSRDSRSGDLQSGSEPANDADEFRAAIGHVRRLPEVADVPRAPKPSATVAMREADERAALAESRRADPVREAEAFGDTLAYRRDDVPPQTLRRLKRAEFAIEDEIDLHASSERAAEELLRRFLAEARDAAHHCVRIVHGKGLHSAQGPVLKGVVERMLNQRADVLAYASAPAAHGGTGAVLVLLARRRPGERRGNHMPAGEHDD
ncbi:MAG TPA: Smr/MutS family protein [Xanthomonadaceae bacterium]|nr:Smr/MutS family protein [Xanthomonadaceae bacterium]